MVNSVSLSFPPSNVLTQTETIQCLKSINKVSHLTHRYDSSTTEFYKSVPHLKHWEPDKKRECLRETFSLRTVLFIMWFTHVILYCPALHVSPLPQQRVSLSVSICRHLLYLLTPFSVRFFPNCPSIFLQTLYSRRLHPRILVPFLFTVISRALIAVVFVLLYSQRLVVLFLFKVLFVC